MASLSLFLCTLLTLSLSFHGISAIDYEVTNLAPNSPSGIIYTQEIGIPYTKELMANVTEFLYSTIFQQNNPSDRKPVSSVNINVGEYKEYLSNCSDNSINISSIVIARFRRKKYHFRGAVYHEMTHVFQWNGEGHANEDLLEGIADYVSIKADYVPSDYVQPGGGNKWDQGFDITARFLEYCDEITPGFVAKLNAKMKSAYDVNYFNELTGKSVDQLWQDYKAKYAH